MSALEPGQSGGDAFLVVEDLALDAGKKPILRDVSFAVAGGSRVALVGANGAGKTSIL
ncbi:MAG: ATP-binding cassette domain-containing protein, partial [Thermoguttaceae bacterium]|nr:ATP-binding cassette domain-containing protein [Thermoguttaceae bacterium]